MALKFIYQNVHDTIVSIIITYVNLLCTHSAQSTRRKLANKTFKNK